MKTTPQIDSNLLVDSEPITQAVAPALHGTKFINEQHRETAKRHTVSVPGARKLPELTTFRALSRQVFGAEAGREYLKEAILFASMMLVAAWPLGVTLNQLGTMMISPPNALW